jgi:hypothetical protein
MSRALRTAYLIALIAGLGACNRPKDDPQPMIEKTMKDLLAYPRSSVVSMSASADAAQLSFSSPDSADRVARWYREYLGLNHWELQNDQHAPDGSISIYAQQGKRPIWIALHPNVGGPGSNYTVISGIPDTTSHAKPLGSPQGNRHPTAN